MADHANHVVPLGLGRRDAEEQPLPHRRLAVKGQRGDRIVDDHLPREVGALIDVVVGVGEQPAFDQPRMQGLEVPWNDEMVGRLAELRGIGDGRIGAPPAVDQLTVERKRRRRRDAGHARNRQQPVAHLLHERRAFARLAGLRRQPEREDVIRIEPRIDAPQRHETAQHQPGPDEQDERERHLGDHHGMTQPPAAAQTR